MQVSVYFQFFDASGCTRIPNGENLAEVAREVSITDGDTRRRWFLVGSTMEANSDVPDKVPQPAPNGADITTAALISTPQLASQKAPSVFCLTVPLSDGAIQGMLRHSHDQREDRGKSASWSRELSSCHLQTPQTKSSLGSGYVEEGVTGPTWQAE